MMKSIFTGLGIAAIATVALTPQAQAAPATYSASNGSATFDYSVRVVMVHGLMTGVSSQVKLDTSDLAKTTGLVTVPLSNLKTGNTLQDGQAKSVMALHTAKYPNATLQLQSLTGGTLKPGQTLATSGTGQLTVKGVTKTVVIPIKATLQGDTVKVATQFKFNPHEYGVTYPASSNSATVNVQFVLKKN